ncbi:DUF1661 domain-containing protein [Porphyromonas gingivalis]|nr:DUF1661 domain-containing protein [Porphyromonas gingivalis]MCE8181734.1 DUF1661 domain-containing protein [Porphyromonas gingivalis]
MFDPLSNCQLFSVHVSGLAFGKTWLGNFFVLVRKVKILRATTEKFSLANFRKYELMSGKNWAVRKFEIKSSLLCHYCSIKCHYEGGKQPNHI